jgi:hypothetical protein
MFLLVAILILRTLDLSLHDWIVHILLFLSAVLLFAVPIYRNQNVRVIDRINGVTPSKAAESYLNNYTLKNSGTNIKKIDYSELPSDHLRNRTGKELYFEVQEEGKTVGYLTVYPVKYQEKRIGWSVKQYKSVRQNQ